MALATVNVTIVIDKESYSIVEIPPQTSGIVIKQKEGLLQQVDLKVSFVYIHSYNVTCYNETGIPDYARNVSNRFQIPHTQTSAELEKRSNFPTASLGTDTTI